MIRDRRIEQEEIGNIDGRTPRDSGHKFAVQFSLDSFSSHLFGSFAREEKQSIVGLLKRGRLPRSLINQAIDRLLDQRRLHVA